MEPYQPPFDVFAAKREKREIRLLGTLSGGAILLYILLQNVLVTGLALLGLYQAYTTQPLMQAGVDILLVIVCLLLPFLAAGKGMARVTGIRDPLMLGAPQSGGSLLLAIPAGVGFCVLANTVSGYLIAFLESFGLELSSPDLPLPDGPLGILVSFFRVVVVAAMVEELCFRGVVMGHLRRYGDGFAIVMASLVFAMMHCNLIQAPFALIVGFALGYLSIRTGTLWTGIVIHAVNNTVSLVFTYLMERMDENVVGLLYSVVTYALLFVGAICFLVLLLRRPRRAAAVRTENTFGAKTLAFFLNPTMLPALALIVWFTAKFVDTAG
ncbi:MAG: CPBP family intramembrane metalloprotease [Clostridia bacterium]|jgi:membrane protease YdiL (CAAX protease family)|nr:CPBP family intramembrane metalloprotease [Clostridia bacterium]